jgi:nucleotide-binding universal stress UspA family protein
MPVLPLLLATAGCGTVLLAAPDVAQLAELYAIGVVGAVAINLGTCATNRTIVLKRFERWGMTGLAVLMVAVWLTIAVEKPHALVFAMSVTGAGLAARYLVKNPAQVRDWMMRDVSVPVVVPAPISNRTSTLAAVLPKPVTPREQRLESAGLRGGGPARSRILVATRGSLPLAQFAIEEAQIRNSELYVLFVRHLAVPLLDSAETVDVRADPEAQAFFAAVESDASSAGVDARYLYAVASQVAETILDFAATCGVDLLILGASQRGTLWRAMKGDVIESVAEHLPDRIRLLIHT